MRRLDRRLVLRSAAIGLALVSLRGKASSQTRKVPVVGYLASSTAESSGIDEIRDHLRALGYVDGISVRILARFTNGRAELLDGFLTEFMHEGVDVIVADGRVTTRAARGATALTPIVMEGVGDAGEFVSNLSRPTENITGFVLRQDKTDLKLVEILREAVPHLSRIAIVRSVSAGAHAPALVSAAQASGMSAFIVDLASNADLERAFASIAAEQANGIIVLTTASLVPIRRRIAALALKHRLPAAASQLGYVRAGFLVSYYADQFDLERNVAAYVDLLIRGIRPADLPVQEPTKFKLVINLRTAAELGLDIPQAALALADGVID